MDSGSGTVIHLLNVPPERSELLDRTGFSVCKYTVGSAMLRGLQESGGIAIVGDAVEADLASLLTGQWPVLLFLGSSIGNVQDSGEVTLLDPGISAAALVSAVRAAIRTVRLQEHVEQTVAEYERNARKSEEDFQQFVYSASHDLKEPLRMISGYLQLLQKRYAASLTGEAQEFLTLAMDGSTRMSKLLSDLLAYSRVGSSPGQSELVNGNDVMLWVRMNRQHLLDESGAQLTNDPLPSVQFNQSEMLQVLEQLIDNAIKFRRQEDPLHIHVSAEEQNGEWLFSVRDNGAGFEPQHADRIFGVFKRLVGREIPGTGMGLAVAKRIVQKYGGRMWAVGEPGQGATIYFTVRNAALAAMR